MAEKHELGITVKKADDMPEWYSQVVVKSGLADYSPVRGTMIIRPYGYRIWENIQSYFNDVLKKRNVENAYFPMFIPESFFKKEAEHAAGFKAEVAWVEQKEGDGERYALRPTSETIMYDSYAKWIRSWRDLPLRINQWCNIVRWEVKDVKMFLRSREFLWQEGHCVYETKKECDKETKLFLKEYQKLSENMLAIPVIAGRKTEKEKFSGALYTLTIEALMPDGKALQMGTSHNLGQGFAKAFNIKYVGKDEKEHDVWQSSWGFSTRLIGSIVLMHGDDKGLVLPPKIAPNKAVIVPILFEETREKVLAKAKEIAKKLKKYDALVDERDEYTPGFKFNEWELKGVPIRIEIGPKDLENNSVILVRRDNGEKKTVKIDNIAKEIKQTLNDIQKSLFDKAKKFLDSHVAEVDSYEQLKQETAKGNMAVANHCGSVECEEEIKTDTNGITTRAVMPGKAEGSCIKCGKKAEYKVYFARNY